MRPLEFYIQQMISDIKLYGFDNYTVLEAMKKVPRHLFAPRGTSMDDAYRDSPIILGEGQTISQPYTVAYMLDLLELHAGSNVLEIGAGSGWNAAIIKEIIRKPGKITSLEIDTGLALKADTVLRDNFFDVRIVNADGSAGYNRNAPYDRIIVTCASPRIYEEWIEQLKPGGIIVAPVGTINQNMIRGVKNKGRLIIQEFGQFRFVPLKIDY